MKKRGFFVSLFWAETATDQIMLAGFFLRPAIAISFGQ